MIDRQKMYLVKNYNGICEIVQLSQAGAFIVVQRLEELHAGCDYYRCIPVLAGFFQL